jgi:hypothetical protein
VEGIPLLKFKVSALHYCAFREAKRDGSLINLMYNLAMFGGIEKSY